MKRALIAGLLFAAVAAGFSTAAFADGGQGIGRAGTYQVQTSQATADGGQVVKTKHAIGPHGYRAIVLDSEGNRVALHSNRP